MGTYYKNSLSALGSAPSSGSTASAPYLGSYYAPMVATYPNTASTLSTITIVVPGIYLIRIYVQLQLATANVSANAYLSSIPGMAAGTSAGFSMPYSSGGFQAADVQYITNVASTYTHAISINSVTSSIATNGITCQYSWLRIA